MTGVVSFLAEHGSMLLAGSTLLLALGVAAVRFSRAPVLRQRVGEVAIAATLLWLVLAVVPLPRLSPPGFGRLAGVDASPQATGPASSAAAMGTSLQAPAVPVAHGPTAGPPSLADQAPYGESARVVPGATDRASCDVSASARPSVAGAGGTPWRGSLALVYLTGAAALILWLALGHVAVVWTGRAARRPEPWLQSLYESLVIPPGVPRPRLLVSPRWSRPVVCGLCRPRILLPAALCRPEEAGQLRHVLLHEVAHAWRKDAWGHLLFNLACPLLYFHPLYWWLRAEVQFARELIADDWAADRSTRESYVEDLVRLARGSRRLVLGSPGALGAFWFRTQFFRRMTMLIDRKKPLATGTSRKWRVLAMLGGVLVLAVMVCLVGLAPSGAEEAAAPPSPAAVGPSAATESPQADSTAASPIAQRGRRRGRERGPQADSTAASPVAVDDQTGPSTAAPGAAKSAKSAANVIEVGRCLVGLIDDIEVAAGAEGLLKEMHAKEGMRVERGQRLARIDDEGARLKLEMAEASLGNLTALEISHKLAEVEAQHAEEEYRRVRELASAKTVSEHELSRARLAAERAQLRTRIATEELKSAQRTGRLEVLTAQNEVARCQLSAPIDGIVVKTHCSAGEWVRPGDPICEIIRMDRLRVKGTIELAQCTPEQALGRDVEVLAQVSRMKDGFRVVSAERAKGKIVFASPKLVSGDRYEFWAEVENPKRNGRWVVLRPGLVVTVRVKTD